VAQKLKIAREKSKIAKIRYRKSKSENSKSRKKYHNREKTKTEDSKAKIKNREGPKNNQNLNRGGGTPYLGELKLDRIG